MTVSMMQLGVDNQGAVHIASYSLTADSSLSSAIADELPTLGGESESVSREKLCTAVAAPECDGSSGIPERCPRPVIQPSVQHRVSNTRMVFNADAKPFVGSLRGVASSAAPANVKGAKVTGSAGSRHSFSRSKFDCWLAGLCAGGCFARSMRLASVLVCSAVERHVLL